MRLKKSVLSVVATVLFTFAPLTTAESTNELRMVEAIRAHVTDEEHTWYQQQHRQYRQQHPDMPLVHAKHLNRTYESPYSEPVYALPKSLSSTSSDIQRILVLANKTLYENAAVKERVDRYMLDIAGGYGCTVALEVLEGGTAIDIKNILKSYYEDGGLDGAIQIGSFPVGWMEFEKDPFFGKYETWACDHFYMDLDGEWIDADKNGFYETNRDGSGDRSPEIFYARIDVAPMGRFGTETEMLCTYLDKSHAYWSGTITLTPSACELVEKDWADSDQYLRKVFGNDNTETFRYGSSTSVSRTDYLNQRLTGDYSLLHLWCHASNAAHYFTDGGELDYVKVYNSNPKPIGYFHDGCSLADWTAADGKGYLGGAYVFNKSPTALVCISGTRTGQWIGNMGKEMFEELAKNTCIGKAYQIWFDKYIKRDMDGDPDYFMAWNYGYVILGDPMISFIHRNETELRANCSQSAENRTAFTYTYNPQTRIIHLTGPMSETTSFEISITTLTGKRLFSSGRIKTSVSTPSLQFNLPDLVSGIYVLIAKSNEQNIQGRFLVP